MINHYTFGSITIDNKTYTHDVIISAGKVKSWWRATSHEVTISDVEPILSESPRMIIFGTGASGVCEVFPETVIYLEKQGIDVKVMRTAEAVDELNRRDKEAGVVGALHLTC